MGLNKHIVETKRQNYVRMYRERERERSIIFKEVFGVIGRGKNVLINQTFWPKLKNYQKNEEGRLILIKEEKMRGERG